MPSKELRIPQSQHKYSKFSLFTKIIKQKNRSRKSDFFITVCRYILNLECTTLAKYITYEGVEGLGTLSEVEEVYSPAHKLYEVGHILPLSARYANLLWCNRCACSYEEVTHLLE